MALVEYSDSDSDSEAPAQPTAAPPTASSKKPFQKVVNRANPGKILVNLPQAKRDESASTSDEPPAKRPKTGGGGGGGGLFAGFSSMLPAPKNAAKRPSAMSGSSSSRPVFQLKTSAEAGFSRESPMADGGAEGSGSSVALPPPKAAPQPSIPDTMKPEEEVKLVGKPMMFRPLSVARNKKKPAKKIPAPAPAPSVAGAATDEAKEAGPAPPPKKISLFSLESEPEPGPDPSAASSSGAYEPLFQTETAANGYDAYGEEAAPYANHPVPTTAPTSDKESLDTIANDLNLSAAERRELFGRGGMTGAQGPSATKVINFNTDREYQHNEDLRAAGQEQTHNPVRSIAPGKHNLRQLVNAVQSNREALEESFAKGKSNRKDASSRYGW